MAKVLYVPVVFLIFFAVYSISGEDLKASEFKEYDKESLVVYSKSSCGYCTKAKELLDKKNLRYTSIDLTWDKELHQKLIKETGQTTVPYVFVQGKLIGGYKDLLELVESGKIHKLLK